LDAMYYYNPLVPVKNEDGTWYRNLNISQNYNPLGNFPICICSMAHHRGTIHEKPTRIR
jgi:hypothetical protein